MISLKNFSIGFKDKILLHDVNIELTSHKLYALIGRNGTGKSTLMKTICGLNDKYTGQIIINGKDLRQITKSKLASLISYVNTQRPRISNLKCREMVALGRTPHTMWHGNLNKYDYEIVDKALFTVGMTDYCQRDFNSLSDGEAQKIMIARAIAQDTPIILLDEPTSFLDLPSRFELAQILRKLTIVEGKTIIFSTHELDLALKFSDYIILFDSHRLNVMSPENFKNETILTNLFGI